LIIGGLFLLAKATHEIHNCLEGTDGHETSGVPAGLGTMLLQIALLDIVFSLDSVITAVGLVDEVSVMATAIIGAVLVMMFAARPIGDFVDAHPTIKILALSFLILVGVILHLHPARAFLDHGNRAAVRGGDHRHLPRLFQSGVVPVQLGLDLFVETAHAVLRVVHEIRWLGEKREPISRQVPYAILAHLSAAERAAFHRLFRPAQVAAHGVPACSSLGHV
ncbi:MAG: hypothetical protein HUU37_09280, partial [Bdellovibrionales bacterium]|nr:hypothetical protein [Bdellovibrionales bacterium]